MLECQVVFRHGTPSGWGSGVQLPGVSSQRSSYPKPFKAQVVQECLQPGATVSSVAINHAINANVIRKWMPL
ncbi:transposase [Pseudomonas soli]|uniref:transposase n=1 Tax=Pseudomonas soli TaxID=1306993 RepID=UPI00345C9631